MLSIDESNTTSYDDANKQETIEDETVDKSFSVVEEESMSSEVTFTENKKENILVESFFTETFGSTQGKSTDPSVGLLFHKRLLQVCNAHKQEMKRHFPENVCRQTNSKQLYQFRSLLFGGSANATVSLSSKLFLFRIGNVEIDRDSRFPTLVFVRLWRCVSFHQHSQDYTVSRKNKRLHAELFLAARWSLLRELVCYLNRTNSGLLDRRRGLKSA